MLFPLGDLDGCLENHQKARELAYRAGSTQREAQALGGLGDAYYLRGQMITAWEHFHRCVTICREHGFSDIEVSNLYMRGITELYRNRLEQALGDSEEAVEAAVRIGHRRAEMIARQACCGWILYDMGQLERSWRELERSLELARSLGALRFQSNSLMFMGKIRLLQGKREEALALAEQSIQVCRDTGFAFNGPIALSVRAYATLDRDVYERSVAEAHEVLQAGSLSHNYLWSYRNCIDAALAMDDYDGVQRFAAALEEYTRAEPLPWSNFYIERARALVAFHRDPQSPEAVQGLRDVTAFAHAHGFATAAAALDRACATLPPGPAMPTRVD